MAPRKIDFGPIDIPLSCTLFLEPALRRWARNIAPVSGEITEFIHDWNLCVIETLKMPENINILGPLGKRLMRGTTRFTNYTSLCIARAPDAEMQSLHYAIRFSESVKFLGDKINENPCIKFVDLGCGLSPLATAIASTHTRTVPYCIDTQPQIADIYGQTTKTMGVCEPEFITWDDARNLATNKKLDTVVAMGVFPYMDRKEQIARMKFINENIPNFLIEAKYNSNEKIAAETTFTPRRLGRLKLEIAHAETIETTMIKNSLRYLHSYMSALATSRAFLERDHSIFFSR